MSTITVNVSIDPIDEAANGDYFRLYTGVPSLGAEERLISSTSTFAQISFGLISRETNVIVEITGTNLDSTNGDAEINSVRIIAQEVDVETIEIEPWDLESIITPTGKVRELYKIEDIAFKANTDEVNNSIDPYAENHQLFRELTELDFNKFDNAYLNKNSFIRWEEGNHFVDFVQDNPAEFPSANDIDVKDYYNTNYAFAGSGTDTIMGSAGFDDLFGGAGNDILVGLYGIDELWGGAGNDLLRGGKGDDTLEGGSGDDTLFGAKDADEVMGNQGDDIVRLGSGDDLGRGGAGSDTLFAARGDDTVRGGGGDDMITGGFGNDLLAGGKGADRFIFRGTTDDDVIADFNGAEGDRIVLRDFNFEGFDAFVAGGRIGSVNGDAVITLEAGTITLSGVDADSLSADYFVF